MIDPSYVLGENMVDSMKNSPHNGPSTPREDMPAVSGAQGGEMTGFNMSGPGYPPDNPVNVSSTSSIGKLCVKLWI